MEYYENFIGSLLPGNYALTKSMELTRASQSGTLWYTKKFLVLYYYIFLSNDIETNEYTAKVTMAFNEYIAALDAEVQPQAERFFYPDNELINFKAEGFKLFSSFAPKRDFEDKDAREAYYQSAKKCYFALLMESGGQKGIKKYLKDALGREDFAYSGQAVAEVIFDAAVRITAQECSAGNGKKDNSLKYILSTQALDEIESRAADGEALDEDTVRQIALRLPKANPQYKSIENDTFAFIRNERQVLYYYGFFHSKSSGASDAEYSSMTPIGELALSANAIEFQIIWEHQKLKMISQPPIADIKDAKPHGSPDKFSISLTPYTDILSALLHMGSLSTEQYRLVISRRNGNFIDDEWNGALDELLGRIQDINAVVQGFGRVSDCRDEDARKELLKYLLGVRGDLNRDKGKNPFGICRMTGGNASCTDAGKLTSMLSLYNKINDYKRKKYAALFARCERELRRRYTADGAARIDPKVKIDWDLYNIHPDRLILAAAAVMYAAFSLPLGQVEDLTKKEQTAAADFLYKRCPNILECVGGKHSAAAAKRAVSQAVSALQAGDYALYMAEEQPDETVVANYRQDSAEGLWRKIEQLSAGAAVDRYGARARSGALVSALKAYYMARYTQNGTLHCECCGKQTFITYAGEPYLEFHHLVPFGRAFGPDHYLNLYALCPNCHRKMHFMAAEGKRELYAKLDGNNYSRLCLVDRLKELKAERLLMSYHLEYLLADSAITQADYSNITA